VNSGIRIVHTAILEHLHSRCGVFDVQPVMREARGALRVRQVQLEECVLVV
jgi:hypothetical protein